jgi:hypothetical protein
MTLRKYNGFAEECGDEGVMQLAITSSDGEFRTIDQWMERNHIRVRPAHHIEKNIADCVHEPLYTTAGKRFRRYTFKVLEPSVVGFRLSFSASSQRVYDDSLFLAYCDRTIHRTVIMPIPRSARAVMKGGAGDFYKKIHDWCKESGIRLVNFAELFRKEDNLPVKGRVMYIHYPIGSPFFMPAVMLTESSDAALYKLAFAE